MQQPLSKKMNQSIVKWAEDTFSFVQLKDNVVKVHTSYVTPFDDSIDFLVKTLEDGTIIVTDDAQISWDFEINNIDLFTKEKVPHNLVSVLEAEGIEIEADNNLVLRTSEEELSEAVSTMLHAILFTYNFIYAMSEK